jgi:hypothetical protein
MVAPKRLNKVCTLAARFAEVVPSLEAIKELMVVPIFAPNTRLAMVEIEK